MKKNLKIVSGVLISAVLIGAILLLLLPVLFDTWVVPRLINKLPFSALELSISKISPWKIRGTISLSQNNTYIFALPRFEIHYSPGSLLKREVNTLLLDSLYVHLNVVDGKIVMDGISATTATDDTKKEFPPLFLPLAAKRVVLRNCTVVLHNLHNKEEKRLFAVNSRLLLHYGDIPGGQKEITKIQGEIGVQGDISLNGTVEADFSSKNQWISIAASLPSLDQLVQLSLPDKGLNINGSAQLEAKVELEGFSRINKYEATVDVSGFRASTNGITVSNSADHPIRIALNGDLQNSQFRLSGIDLNEPEELNVNLAGAFSLAQQHIKGNGTAQIATLNATSPFTFAFTAHKETDTSSLDITLEGKPFDLAGIYDVGSVQLQTKATLANNELKGTLQGNLDFAVARDMDVEAKELKFFMPFQFPPKNDNQKSTGYLNIGQISYQKTPIASVDTTLVQTQTGIKFASALSVPFIDQLLLNCSGEIEPSPRINAECHLNETSFDSSTFPDFAKIPDFLSITGTVSLDSIISYNNSGPNGELTVNVSETDITAGETLFSGVSTTIHIPELNRLASSPSQLCTIDFLNFGNITMSDARIRFRIENAETLFLEKARLSWCGGKVESGALTLNSDMKQLETTLYCDRLGFSDLLQQFGIEGTEGEGSLNGKLPVVLNTKTITFDDGFLFSTPGNGGIVKFNNTDQLRQGMPNIEATPYLDYSMKALGNFSYNWTKLTFNTVDDDLLMTMQLDGKPAVALPFGYKNGQIIATGKGQGLQHPIRLDVNFRLPLQELFQYGKNFQSLMENM
jgi:hypothetical protein